MSPRHLSFVETGRSKPSPELLLALADGLEVPLRERNTLLVAAGYAPRYRETALDATSMTRARSALQRMLDTHHPYPGVVIDLQWNVVLANAAAGLLTSVLPPELLAPPINVFRACLHPDGLARATLNFDEWATYLVGQLHRIALLTDDAELNRLAKEVDGYPNVVDVRTRRREAAFDEPALLVPLRLAVGGDELSMFTTLTTFGTPQDITLSELAVELFFPADDHTDAWLRAADTSRHD